MRRSGQASFSEEDKKKIYKIKIEEDLPISTLAERFCCSVDTIRRILRNEKSKN